MKNIFAVRKIYKIEHYKANGKAFTHRVWDKKETYKSLTYALLEITKNCLYENKIITNIEIREDDRFDYLNIYYDTEELEK